MSREPDQIDMMGEEELRKEFRVLVKKNINQKKAMKKAQEKLRSTQENWREQCLFEADEIMTKALKGK